MLCATASLLGCRTYSPQSEELDLTSIEERICNAIGVSFEENIDAINELQQPLLHLLLHSMSSTDVAYVPGADLSTPRLTCPFWKCGNTQEEEFSRNEETGDTTCLRCGCVAAEYSLDTEEEHRTFADSTEVCVCVCVCV